MSNVKTLKGTAPQPLVPVALVCILMGLCQVDAAEGSVFAVSGDGARLCWGSPEGRAAVWRFKDGKRLHNFGFGKQLSQAFITEDGKWFLGSYENRLTMIYRFGEKRNRFFGVLSGGAFPCNVVPKSEFFLALPGDWEMRENTRLELRRLGDPASVRYIGQEKGGVAEYVASADGTAILFCRRFRGRKLWDTGIYSIPDDRVIARWEEPKLGIGSVLTSFLPQKDMFVEWSARSAHVRRATTGDALWTARLQMSEATLMGAWLSADGKLLVVVTRLWSEAPPSWLLARKESGAIPCAACWVWAIEAQSFVRVFGLKTVNSPWGLLERVPFGAIEGRGGGSSGDWFCYLDFRAKGALARATKWDIRTGSQICSYKLFGEDRDLESDPLEEMKVPSDMVGMVAVRKASQAIDSEPRRN